MRSAELSGLLERVKKATGPDREIDCYLQVYANGGTGQFRSAEAWTKAAIAQNWNVPRHTASIDAALALAKERLPEWRPTISQHIAPRPHWRAALRSWERIRLGTAATAPLAILAALLLALIKKESDDAGA